MDTEQTNDIDTWQDEPEEPVLEVEGINVGLKIAGEKVDVNAYDIFRLAKYILITAASFYLLFALIRIFYCEVAADTEGIKEVWEYSKIILNSIVSLVLGLYFGSKQEAKAKS